MKYLILTLSLCLVACAKKGGDSTAETAQKSVWSTWTRTDNALSFNLSGGSFNQSLNIGWALGGGVNCVCQMTVSGSESSGSWTQTGCAGHASCSSINGSGTYQRSSSSQMLFCDSSCGTYN